MKVVLAILMMLAVSTFAKCALAAGTPSLNNIKTGSELIRYIEGDLPGTYLIFFYDRNTDTSRVQKYRNAAREQILSRHPDILYYEIDVDDADFNDVIALANIDLVEVEHLPTFWLTTNGLGYTIHGEDAVSHIAKDLSNQEWWLAHRYQSTAKPTEEEEAAKAQ